MLTCLYCFPGEGRGGKAKRQTNKRLLTGPRPSPGKRRRDESDNATWYDYNSDPARFVVISGCSSGGKSTLLAELARRGHAVVEEPGRRIVAQELDGDGAALPWVDGIAFARRAIELALADRSATESQHGLTFFDRSVIDAASALEHLTGERLMARSGGLPRYHKTVFLVDERCRTCRSYPEDADAAA